MRPRISSPDQISAMIPLIARIADDLAAVYARAAALLEIGPSSSALDGVDAALDELQTYVVEIEKLGGTVRSHEPLTIDFIAEVDGEIGYVCYRHGDSKASHFHAADADCSARREVRRAPELTAA